MSQSQPRYSGVEDPAPPSNRCSLYQPASIRPNLDFLGLPELPEIPQVLLCLHLPGSNGWQRYWRDFNRKVKDFHQSMIDFNYKMLEWYSLKSKQLERFGIKTPYSAGTVVSGPRITVIYTRTTEGDVIAEVKKYLPEPFKRELIHLEKVGYKLCLLGKTFIFSREKVTVVDYDRETDKSFYRDCLKFALYEKNERINIFETYARVYGGLKFSFIVGGVGGIAVSLLTGYYEQVPCYSRKCVRADHNLMWLMSKRWLASSLMYTVIERLLLLRFTQPQRYVLAGTAGFLCGMLLGVFDCCDSMTMTGASVEFGIHAFLCNYLLHKKKTCIEDDM